MSDHEIEEDELVEETNAEEDTNEFHYSDSKAQDNSPNKPAALLEEEEPDLDVPVYSDEDAEEDES